MGGLNGLLWVFSIVLAVVFLITPVIRTFCYDKARNMFPWVQDVPCLLVHLIGVLEILGALGLILPVATGIYTFLTPYAGFESLGQPGDIECNTTQ